MMMKDSILHFAFSINVVDAGACWSGSQAVTFCAILFGCAVLFVHSVMEERGVSVGEALCRKPLPVRFAVLLLLVLSLVLIGSEPLSQGGFIYANF